MMLAQEIALKLGLSPRTLLDYQHKGIIKPRRDRHGRWLYTDEHITAIRSHHRLPNLRPAE